MWSISFIVIPGILLLVLCSNNLLIFHHKLRQCEILFYLHLHNVVHPLTKLHAIPSHKKTFHQIHWEPSATYVSSSSPSTKHFRLDCYPLSNVATIFQKLQLFQNCSVYHEILPSQRCPDKLYQPYPLILCVLCQLQNL